MRAGAGLVLLLSVGVARAADMPCEDNDRAVNEAERAYRLHPSDEGRDRLDNLKAIADECMRIDDQTPCAAEKHVRLNARAFSIEHPSPRSRERFQLAFDAAQRCMQAIDNRATDEHPAILMPESFVNPPPPVKPAKATKVEPSREQIGQDPKHLPFIFGAELCYDRQVRADAIAEIGKEKKYSKLGGVFDKDKVYKLQQRVRWADEHEADARKRLAGFQRVKAAPCNNPIVQATVACVGKDCEGAAGLYASFVVSPDDEE